MDLLTKQLDLALHGRLDEAYELALQLEKERPACNRCAFNRGWFKLWKGEFQEGFKLLDRGRLEKVYGGPDPKTKQPVWDGSSSGNTVLLYLEGGYGDEICFVRFARDLKCFFKRVIVACQPTLWKLFASLPEIDAMIHPEVAHAAHYDCWVPGFSSAWLTGTTYQTLSGKPYLKADPRNFYFPRGKKIGLRFSGNPKFEHEQHRKFPPHLLIEGVEPLREEARFYSFQKPLDFELPDWIKDLGPQLLDWHDTAACISQMDLLITSCTATAHLGGALGVPTTVILPILPYYIWSLPGDKSPWYDSVTLLRQTAYEDWDFLLQTERYRKQLHRSA